MSVPAESAAPRHPLRERFTVMMKDKRKFPAVLLSLLKDNGMRKAGRQEKKVSGRKVRRASQSKAAGNKINFFDQARIVTWPFFFLGLDSFEKELP